MFVISLYVGFLLACSAIIVLGIVRMPEGKRVRARQPEKVTLRRKGSAPKAPAPSVTEPRTVSRNI